MLLSWKQTKAFEKVSIRKETLCASCGFQGVWECTNVSAQGQRFQRATSEVFLRMVWHGKQCSLSTAVWHWRAYLQPRVKSTECLRHITPHSSHSYMSVFEFVLIAHCLFLQIWLILWTGRRLENWLVCTSCASPTYSFFKPWPQLTTDWYVVVVHYWTLISTRDI